MIGVHFVENRTQATIHEWWGQTMVMLMNIVAIKYFIKQT